MICKSYCLQFDTILEYHVKNELKSIHELNDMIITLQNTTSEKSNSYNQKLKVI